MGIKGRLKLRCEKVIWVLGGGGKGENILTAKATGCGRKPLFEGSCSGEKQKILQGKKTKNERRPGLVIIP